MKDLKIFAIILSLLFPFSNNGADDAVKVILSSQELPIGQQTGAANLTISKESWGVTVFGDGLVQGMFKVQNGSNSLKYSLKLKFSFYSDSDKEKTLHTYEHPDEYILPESELSSINYAFKIPKEKAKDIKAYDVAIESQAHSELQSFEGKSRFFVLYVVGVTLLFLGVLVLLYKRQGKGDTKSEVIR